MKTMKNILFLTILLLTLTACGSGGGIATNPTQQNTVTMKFATETSTAPYVAMLNGMSLTVHLPVGVTAPCTVTGLVGTLAVDETTAFSVTNQSFKFDITQADQSVAIAVGVFASLTCAVKAGYTLDKNVNFPKTTLFPAKTDLIILGNDTATSSYIDLITANQLSVSVSDVSFN